jgi:hypothetical protein
MTVQNMITLRPDGNRRVQGIDDSLLPPGAVKFDPANTAPNMTLSNQNTTVTNSVGTWEISRGENSYSTGLHAAEFTVDHVLNDRLCMLGIVSASTALSSQIGSNAFSYGYFASSGQTSHLSNSINYGTPYTDGDLVTVLLDSDNAELSYWVNGVDQGVAHTSVTGTFFVAAGLLGTGANHKTVSLNSVITHAFPAGYSNF